MLAWYLNTPWALYSSYLDSLQGHPGFLDRGPRDHGHDVECETRGFDQCEGGKNMLGANRRASCNQDSQNEKDHDFGLRRPEGQMCWQDAMMICNGGQLRSAKIVV